MTSLDRLFQALSTENPAPFPLSPESVSISIPEAVTGEGYNTKIIVSAKPDSGYYGSVPVYYSRINLAALGTNIGLVSEVPFTKESFLAALNEARQAWVTESDLETVALPLQTTGVVLSVPLHAVNENYGWTGNNTISIVIGLPKEANLLHQLLHTTMSGLGYW
jgi:hypothetical protein